MTGGGHCCVAVSEPAKGKDNVAGRIDDACDEGKKAACPSTSGSEEVASSGSTEGLRIVASTVAGLQQTMGGALQKMAATVKQSRERCLDHLSRFRKFSFDSARNISSCPSCV